MNYLGDYLDDETINFSLTTSDGSGGAVAPSSAFEAADLLIYKNNSATQKTTTNGVTMTSPFDTIVGLHQVSIDTSNDTGDAGFWTTGSDYTVILSPDETVDGQTVVSVVAHFSIENRLTATINANLISRTLLSTQYMRNVGQGIAQGGTSTTITLKAASSFAINELRGTVVSIPEGTGEGQSRWISGNTGAATDIATIVPPWITIPDATTDYQFSPGPASVQAFLDSALSEDTTSRIATNLGTFYNNDDALTTKVVDDVGAGTLFPSAGWTWSTATSGVPNAGRLRGNNATIASITELSIHQETADGRNAGIVISALRDGDKIGVFFDINPDIFLIFDVTATPILTGSVYAVTGTVDSTSGTFANTVVTVSYQITGNTEAAVANREEMDSNSVDLNTLVTGQTTINDNVLLIPTTAMRGTDSALLAADINLTGGAVDNVTLVATTTTNTDQRGTDNAALATALATAQLDLDTITGSDGATLATLQPNEDFGAITKNAALLNFEFLMVLASDNVTPGTGLTVSGQRSVDGSAFASVTGGITEISNGIYQFDADATDTNGDLITWRFSAATADDTFITFKTVS